MFSIYGKFPAAQWVEHCTAKAVPVRMEILFRGICRFIFFFFLFVWSTIFLGMIRSFSHFFQPCELSGSSLYASPLQFTSLHYIGECFLPTIGRVSPFPSLSHSGHASIETLLPLNIIKLNNKILRFPQSFWVLVPCSKYSNCYI